MTWRSAATQVPYRCSALLVLALQSAGCGEDSSSNDASPGPVDGGEALTTYEPCPIERDLGEFYVQLAADYTSVGGRVFDRVDPETLTEEIASQGSCRLVAPVQRLCDPPCAFSTEQCGTGDVCVPRPAGRDLGTVSVHGLSRPVSMTPNTNTKSYSAAPPVPHPGFEPGASISLSTMGGDFEPLTLRGWGVSLFELTEPVRVDSGMATALRWTAPADPGPARVTVNLNINLHGSNKAWIECDFPDTGAADIPALLIDGLIAQGVTGFPTITLSRRTASSAEIEPGCVELLVRSEVAQDVAVAGLTSCNQDMPCPDGLTCQTVEMLCD